MLAVGEVGVDTGSTDRSGVLESAKPINERASRIRLKAKQLKTRSTGSKRYSPFKFITIYSRPKRNSLDALILFSFS